MPATAALAKLEALDRDDLDTSFTHLRDRERVPLIGDDHTRLEREDVVAVVPLLALLLVGVATGLDHMELGNSQGVGHGRDEILLGPDIQRARLRARPQAHSLDTLDDLRE